MARPLRQARQKRQKIFVLRGTQNRLAVARRNAENQRQTLDLTIALLEGGRGTELDTSRAEAHWESTLASIPPSVGFVALGLSLGTNGLAGCQGHVTHVAQPLRFRRCNRQGNPCSK